MRLHKSRLHVVVFAGELQQWEMAVSLSPLPLHVAAEAMSSNNKKNKQRTSNIPPD